MPALVSTMPMPSYGRLNVFSHHGQVIRDLGTSLFLEGQVNQELSARWTALAPEGTAAPSREWLRGRPGPKTIMARETKYRYQNMSNLKF